MIIRYGGGNHGIAEYLENGRKAEREYTRDELDHRFIYTQSFVDGLTSLTYNCGPDGVRKTRFWKRMKACRYDKKTKAINKKDLIYAIEAVKTANISRIYYAEHKSRRKAEHNKMTEEV